MDSISNFFGGDETDTEGLRGLFIGELKGIYYAERQLIDALAEQADAATTDEVRNAFLQHQEETRGQVERLERVFGSIGVEVDDKTCEAVDGLISDTRSMISDTESGSLTRDAALIIASQKVEHHEIAAYGSLKTFARVLGYSEAAQLLEQTLQEEKNTDKALTKLAESFVNQRAAGETDTYTTYRDNDNDDDVNQGTVSTADTGTYRSGEAYGSGAAIGGNPTYGSSGTRTDSDKTYGDSHLGTGSGSTYGGGSTGFGSSGMGGSGMGRTDADMDDLNSGTTKPGTSTPGYRSDRDATLGGTSGI